MLSYSTSNLKSETETDLINNFPMKLLFETSTYCKAWNSLGHISAINTCIGVAGGGARGAIAPPLFQK